MSEHDTYFIVGVKDGVPVVYLETEVEGFTRKRVASMKELRRVVDMCSSELHLRAIAASVLEALKTPSPEEDIQERMERAMRERMKEDA